MTDIGVLKGALEGAKEKASAARKESDLFSIEFRAWYDGLAAQKINPMTTDEYYARDKKKIKLAGAIRTADQDIRDAAEAYAKVVEPDEEAKKLIVGGLKVWSSGDGQRRIYLKDRKRYYDVITCSYEEV
jgi:hypothetical protein